MKTYFIKLMFHVYFYWPLNVKAKEMTYFGISVLLYCGDCSLS